MNANADNIDGDNDMENIVNLSRSRFRYPRANVNIAPIGMLLGAVELQG